MKPSSITDLKDFV